MREIKFRGKSLITGEWIYGDLAHNYDSYIRPIVGIDRLDSDEFIKVNDKTVGQYTGLKDENGRDIYEGDILKTDLSRPYNVVVFRNGAFMYQCHDSGEDYFDIMVPIDPETGHSYLEVIGNIYETPDLLKEG